jgi:hypothetical protein
MDQVKTFIQRISTHLQMQGFLFDDSPVFNGTHALLYARSRRPYLVPFARVEDHFLFLDWKKNLACSKENMISAYAVFNRQVNSQYHIPHVFRLTIPGMALAVLSTEGFDATTIEYARNTYLVPFKGGEVGQFFLVDLANRDVIYHERHEYKQTGQAPLRMAQGVLVPGLIDSLRDDYVVPWKRAADETFPVNPYR